MRPVNCSLSRLRPETGLSLVEAMIGLVIASIAALAFISLTNDQIRSINYFNYQLAKSDFEREIRSAFLANKDHCTCLFANAAPTNFSATASDDTLVVATPPVEIGRFEFPTPGSCVGATVSNPIVSSVGTGFIKATSIGLKHMKAEGGGLFKASLEVGLTTTKSVLGPKELVMQIPIEVQATIAGSNATFESCSITGGGSLGEGDGAAGSRWEARVGAWKKVCEEAGGVYLYYGANLCQFTQPKIDGVAICGGSANYDGHFEYSASPHSHPSTWGTMPDWVPSSGEANMQKFCVEKFGEESKLSPLEYRSEHSSVTNTCKALEKRGTVFDLSGPWLVRYPTNYGCSSDGECAPMHQGDYVGYSISKATCVLPEDPL